MARQGLSLHSLLEVRMGQTGDGGQPRQVEQAENAAPVRGENVQGLLLHREIPAEDTRPELHTDIGPRRRKRKMMNVHQRVAGGDTPPLSTFLTPPPNSFPRFIK